MIETQQNSYAKHDTIPWVDYASQYTRVVCQTPIYKDMLCRLIGEDGVVPSLKPGSSVLDLGGGSGSLSKRIAMSDSAAHITLIDNDSSMLNLAADNCASHLVDDADTAGIRIIEYDLSELTSLAILRNNSWDYVFFVNVLYVIDRPIDLLKVAYDLLKQGGELRLTEPRKDTKVEVLLQCLEDSVTQQSNADLLWSDWLSVKNFNIDALSGHLKRWSLGELVDCLKSLGFSLIQYASENIYAEQSIIIVARK